MTFNLLLVLGLSLVPASASSDPSGCYSDSSWTGVCEVSNSGEQVDIGASITNPAAPPSGGGASPAVPVPAVPEPIANPCTSMGTCGGHYVVEPPDLTAEDLASFRPAAPSLSGEPSGFGIVGAPANVVASASAQTMTGTVLDWDVTVRFEPAGFVFDYGDGATLRSTTGGASWAALGQAQFTPTATSHVYRARGTYPVRVTVQYAASVDFGSGLWRPVPGYVTATAGGYDVQVVEARTALVDRTCTEDPTGPGC